MGRHVLGNKALMRRIHEGGLTPYEGDLTLIDYIISEKYCYC